MPIPDTAVPLAQELIPRDGVLGYVPLHNGKRPREQRVEFEEACGVYFEWLEGRSVCALRGAPTGYNGLDVQFRESSSSGFDLKWWDVRIWKTEELESDLDNIIIFIFVTLP